jgi:hypothetical protein
MKRVVVTGMGLVTPLGCGLDSNWNKLISGNSGAVKISKFDVSNYPCKIAGSIDDSKIDGEIVSSRDQRKIAEQFLGPRPTKNQEPEEREVTTEHRPRGTQEQSQEQKDNSSTIEA